MGNAQMDSQDSWVPGSLGSNRVHPEDDRLAGLYVARGTCLADSDRARAVWNAVHTGIPPWRRATGHPFGGAFVRSARAQDRCADHPRDLDKQMDLGLGWVEA